MSKIWAWAKKHWKWIVFPVGILLVVLSVLGWLMDIRKKDDPISGTTDEDANRAVDDIFKASREKEAAIVELEKRHAAKVAVMSEQQRAEYKEIKKKPIEEVASWIDKL